MTSYIPVISTLSNNLHDACLIDSSALIEKHKMKGSIVVVKAGVYVTPSDKWCFSIEDFESQVIILEHCPGFKTPSFVDIIQLLGHNLTLLPKQKLLFHTEGEVEQSVSYIYFE